MTPDEFRSSGHTLIDWIADYLEGIERYPVGSQVKPGDKIKWSVLIKGIQGDGKSYLGEVLRAVMGIANVGTVSPKVLNTDYNGWAEGHCVCLLEELRMAGHNRHDVLNALKELHTNDIVTIHKKKENAYAVFNTQNYLGFTNYSDALPLDDADRRWFVTFSQITSVEELEESGMDVIYFDTLFTLLTNHVGALRTYFLDRDLSGFRAKGRAPDSAAKDAMIAIAAHDEDEVIREIIETGLVGVSKNVVSTSHLTTHLMMTNSDIEVPKGRGIASILTRLGFNKVTKQVKWKGNTCRVWVKPLSVSQDMVKVRQLLDDTDVEEIGQEF